MRGKAQTIQLLDKYASNDRYKIEVDTTLFKQSPKLSGQESRRARRKRNPKQ